MPPFAFQGTAMRDTTGFAAARIAGALFATVLVVRPQFSGAASPFVEGLFAVLALLTVSLLVLSGEDAPASGSVELLPIIFALCLYAWVLVSLAWSVDRGGGASEIVTLTTVLAGFFASYIFMKFPSDRVKCLMVLVPAVSIPVAVRAVYQKFIGLDAIGEVLARMSAAGQEVGDLAGYVASGRVFAGFLNPNMLAAFCAMSIPLLIFIAARARTTLHRVLFACLPVFLAIVLLLTGSLGGTLAAASGVLVLAILWGKIGRKVGIGLFAASLILLLGVISVRGTGFLFGHDGSVTQRVGYMAAGARMYLAKPLTGWGTGSVPGTLMGFVSSSVRPVNDPHNFIVRALAAWGIIGTLILSAFLISLARCVYESINMSRDRALTAALFGSSAAFLLHSLIDMTFFVPETALFGWAVMGGALGSMSRPSSRPIRASGRGPARIALGVVLMFLCIPMLYFFQTEFVYFQGRQSFFKGEFAEAAKLFGDARTLMPFKGQYPLMKGRSEVVLGNYQEARSDFTAASKLLPASPYPLWELARLYAGEDDYDRALALLDDAGEKFPTSPWIRIERARIMMEQGRGEDSLLELLEAKAYTAFDMGAAKIVNNALASVGQEAIDRVLGSQDLKFRF